MIIENDGDYFVDQNPSRGFISFGPYRGEINLYTWFVILYNVITDAGCNVDVFHHYVENFSSLPFGWQREICWLKGPELLIFRATLAKIREISKCRRSIILSGAWSGLNLLFHIKSSPRTREKFPECAMLVERRKVSEINKRSDRRSEPVISARRGCDSFP